MNQTLKNSLFEMGDQAFVSLSQEINYMLDLIDFYLNRYPNYTQRDDLIHKQLEQAILTLGTLPHQLATVLKGFKRAEDRIISRIGVEVDLINEIWLTLECTMMFFIRCNMSLEPYTRWKAEKAFFDLIRVNNCL